MVPDHRPREASPMRRRAGRGTLRLPSSRAPRGRAGRERAETECLPRGALAINKITWAQVGLVTEPGRYMFRFGWLMITADDLAIWKQFPNAVFTLYSAGTTTQAGGEKAEEEFRLGTFELPANSSSSGEGEK
jgi:hypothetical protein